MRDDDGGYDAGISHGAEFSCGRLRAREFDWRRAGDATTTAATVDVGVIDVKEEVEEHVYALSQPNSQRQRIETRKDKT